MNVGDKVKVIRGTRDSALLPEGSTHTVAVVIPAGFGTSDYASEDRERVILVGEEPYMWNTSRFEAIGPGDPGSPADTYEARLRALEARIRAADER